MSSNNGGIDTHSILHVEVSSVSVLIDYWLYNLVNLDTMRTTIPFQSQQPVFSKVGNILDLINMTPEELERYNISLDTYRTNRAVMLNERAEGVEEGLVRGREEGRAEIAQKMKSEGSIIRELAKKPLIMTKKPDWFHIHQVIIRTNLKKRLEKLFRKSKPPRFTL